MVTGAKPMLASFVRSCLGCAWLSSSDACSIRVLAMGLPGVGQLPPGAAMRAGLVEDETLVDRRAGQERGNPRTIGRCLVHDVPFSIGVDVEESAGPSLLDVVRTARGRLRCGVAIRAVVRSSTSSWSPLAGRGGATSRLSVALARSRCPAWRPRLGAVGHRAAPR